MDNFLYLMKSKELYDFAEQLSQSGNGKRKITDIAISKIPYVVYPDLDINQSLIIHEFAELCLTKAQNENEHNEVAITYDLDNNLSLENGFQPIIEKAGICYGTEIETDLFSDTQTMSTINRAKNVAVINLHNHPGCSSFSVQDISLFIAQAAIKLMVVVGNNGELYYMSKNLNKYVFRDAMNYLIKVTNVIHPNFTTDTHWPASELREIADLFLKQSDNLGIEYMHVLASNRELNIKKNTMDERGKIL